MRNSLEVAEYIEQLLKNKNMKPIEFAKIIGVDRSTITRYLNGSRKISMDDLPKMAATLGISPINLLIDENAVEETQVTEGIELPLYGSVAAGALAVVEGVTTSDIEYISMPQKLLGKYSNCGDMFAMTVNGESMNKIIKNESIVIAKPMDSLEYKDGDIVIFSYNNEYSLKRFSPNELEGFVLFKSESTDKTFKDIPVPKDTLNDLKIYGKVVFYGTSL